MRVLSALFLIVLALWFGAVWGPTLLDDWDLRGKNLTMQSNVQVVTVCNTNVFGLRSCVVASNDPRVRAAQLEHGMNYLFFSVEPVEKFNMMRGGNPQIYTTDMGMQFLFNRVLTLLALSGLPILVGLLALVRQGMRG